MTYTDEQIAELRKKYDIPAHLVPVASAPGVIAWAVQEANEEHTQTPWGFMPNPSNNKGA